VLDGLKKQFPALGDMIDTASKIWNNFFGSGGTWDMVQKRYEDFKTNVLPDLMLVLRILIGLFELLLVPIKALLGVFNLKDKVQKLIDDITTDVMTAILAPFKKLEPKNIIGVDAVPSSGSTTRSSTNTVNISNVNLYSMSPVEAETAQRFIDYIYSTMPAGH
jgi:hypothetical protein